MQLNKVRLNNATEWDVAKYNQFISNGAQEYLKQSNVQGEKN